jgi:hypothetical protein
MEEINNDGPAIVPVAWVYATVSSVRDQDT